MQVFTKSAKTNTLLIEVKELAKDKGAKLLALKESVTFIRDSKYINRYFMYSLVVKFSFLKNQTLNLYDSGFLGRTAIVMLNLES